MMSYLINLLFFGGRLITKVTEKACYTTSFSTVDVRQRRVYSEQFQISKSLSKPNYNNDTVKSGIEGNSIANSASSLCNCKEVSEILKFTKSTIELDKPETMFKFSNSTESINFLKLPYGHGKTLTTKPGQINLSCSETQILDYDKYFTYNLKNALKSQQSTSEDDAKHNNQDKVNKNDIVTNAFDYILTKQEDIVKKIEDMLPEMEVIGEKLNTSISKSKKNVNGDIPINGLSSEDIQCIYTKLKKSHDNAQKKFDSPKNFKFNSVPDTIGDGDVTLKSCIEIKDRIGRGYMISQASSNLCEYSLPMFVLEPRAASTLYYRNTKICVTRAPAVTTLPNIYSTILLHRSLQSLTKIQQIRAFASDQTGSSDEEIMKRKAFITDDILTNKLLKIKLETTSEPAMKLKNTDKVYLEKIRAEINQLSKSLPLKDTLTDKERRELKNLLKKIIQIESNKRYTDIFEENFPNASNKTFKDKPIIKSAKEAAAVEAPKNVVEPSPPPANAKQAIATTVGRVESENIEVTDNETQTQQSNNQEKKAAANLLTTKTQTDTQKTDVAINVKAESEERSKLMAVNENVFKKLEDNMKVVKIIGTNLKDQSTETQKMPQPVMDDSEDIIVRKAKEHIVASTQTELLLKKAKKSTLKLNTRSYPEESGNIKDENQSKDGVISKDKKKPEYKTNSSNTAPKYCPGRYTTEMSYHSFDRQLPGRRVDLSKMEELRCTRAKSPDNLYTSEGSTIIIRKLQKKVAFDQALYDEIECLNPFHEIKEVQTMKANDEEDKKTQRNIKSNKSSFANLDNIECPKYLEEANLIDEIPLDNTNIYKNKDTKKVPTPNPIEAKQILNVSKDMEVVNKAQDKFKISPKSVENVVEILAKQNKSEDKVKNVIQQNDVLKMTPKPKVTRNSTSPTPILKHSLLAGDKVKLDNVKRKTPMIYNKNQIKKQSFSMQSTQNQNVLNNIQNRWRIQNTKNASNYTKVDRGGNASEINEHALPFLKDSETMSSLLKPKILESEIKNCELFKHTSEVSTQSTKFQEERYEPLDENEKKTLSESMYESKSALISENVTEHKDEEKKSEGTCEEVSIQTDPSATTAQIEEHREPWGINIFNEIPVSFRKNCMHTLPPLPSIWNPQPKTPLKLIQKKQKEENKKRAPTKTFKRYKYETKEVRSPTGKKIKITYLVED